MAPTRSAPRPTLTPPSTPRAARSSRASHRRIRSGQLGRRPAAQRARLRTRREEARFEIGLGAVGDAVVADAIPDRAPRAAGYVPIARAKAALQKLAIR